MYENSCSYVGDLMGMNGLGTRTAGPSAPACLMLVGSGGSCFMWGA